MKDLRVLHITSVHPALDNRIHFKEVKTLQAHFAELAIVASIEEDQEIDGIQYLAIGKFGSRLDRFRRAPKQILNRVEEFDPDLVHFHDPELIPLALKLKRQNYKVIYDVHEDLPTQLKYKSWIPFFLRPLVSYFVRLVEAHCAKKIDAIVAATNDIANRFPKSKTICVRNLPILNLIRIDHSASQQDKFRIIYAGGLARLRGIKETIQALQGLEDRVELCLIGKWESEEYQKECEDLREYQAVRYLGYLSMAEVYSEIGKADLGMAMLYPLKNYLRSLPVKAFEYMAHGVPIIMSDFPFWKEQFEGAAFFARAKDPASISQSIKYALDHPTELDKMSAYAQDRVKEELNWEKESEALLNLYHSLSTTSDETD